MKNEDGICPSEHPGPGIATIYWRVFLGSYCLLHKKFFVLARSQITQCLMPPLPVIPDFYKLKYSQPCLGLGYKSGMIDQLSFYGFEKAFGYGFVPTIALSAHIFASIRKSASMNK
jgi:hypothetical protein